MRLCLRGILLRMSERKEKLAAWVKGHLRKGKDGKVSLVRHHKREEARGIPDRKDFGTIPKIKEPQMWEMAVQKHKAKRAGEHFDLRLGVGQQALSWALRYWPEPGQKTLAIRQPVHTRGYMRWEGTIPSGYGAGDVKLHDHGHVEVVETSENKVIFNRFDGKKTEEFVLIKPPGDRLGPKQWLLINRTTTEGKYKYPREKAKYKSVPYSKDLHKLDGSIQPKVDGAHALVILQSGKRPRVFSYRTSKRGDVLEYTHKVPGLFKQKVPKGINAILRAEIFLTDEDGKALPARRTAGILNAGIEKSRELQKGTGGLKIMPFDFVSKRDLPYEARLSRVEDIASRLPFLVAPEVARTEDEKKALVRKILFKKHPLTEEGVIVGGGTKAKIVDDKDVYVREVFPGKGRHTGSAGGFTYSRTPDGPIVGRVGTGFSDEQRKTLHKAKGRAAKVTYQSEMPSGALFAPRFSGFHVDKNLGS